MFFRSRHKTEWVLLIKGLKPSIFLLAWMLTLLLAQPLLAMQNPPSQTAVELIRPTIQLWVAIANNDIVGLRQALDAGANPHTQDIWGNTPLIAAITRGNIVLPGDREIAQQGFTPDTVTMVQILLERAPEAVLHVEPRDTTCFSVIEAQMRSARLASDPAKISILLSIDELLSSAQSRLSEAEKRKYISKKNLASLRHYLEKFLLHPDDGRIQRVLNDGADVDSVDRDGNTVLHNVVLMQLGYYTGTWLYTPVGVEMVQLLLNKGASTLLINSVGKTPLDIVNERLNKYPDAQGIENLQRIRDLLSEAQARQLAKQREQRSLPILRRLMAEPGLYLQRLPPDLRRIVQTQAAPATFVTNDQIHMLITAIRSGNMKMIRGLLTAQRFNADATDEFGTPVIALAALRGNVAEACEIVELLIPRVTNLNPTFRGQRLLDLLHMEPNRQAIINLIGNAMRSRGVLDLSAMRRRPSFIARIFGSHS